VMRSLAVAAVLVLLCATGHSALAGTRLYRWKDANGNPVMSDRPPPAGVQFEAISTSSSLVRPVDSETPERAPVATPQPAPTPRAEAPKETAQAAEPSAKTAKKNPKLCEQARQNLEVLDRAPRIRMPDANGELYYLTDEQREQERQKNLAIVDTNCE